MLHLDQGGPLWLRFDDPDGLAVEEQEVVDSAVPPLEHELPDRDPDPGADVGLVGLLDHPSGCHELLVDVLAGLRLASEVVVIRIGHER